MNIASKVALITGAADGLGKAFAEELLKKAAIKGVSLVDVHPEKGPATEKEFRQKYGADKAIFLQCDVSCSDQLKDVFQTTKEHFGGLDIVVNNAGIMDEPDWINMVNINLKAVIEGTYLAQHHMSKQNGGQGGVVINTASTAGLTPISDKPVYSATSHGVIAFARSLTKSRQFFTRDDIRLNTFCPAFINSPHQEKGRIDADDATAEKLKSTWQLPPTDKVTAAFLELIEGPHHGQVMRMTATSGMRKYATQP